LDFWARVGVGLGRRARIGIRAKIPMQVRKIIQLSMDMQVRKKIFASRRQLLSSLCPIIIISGKKVEGFRRVNYASIPPLLGPVTHAFCRRCSTATSLSTPAARTTEAKFSIKNQGFVSVL
jgi:hypothetical protein